jgi:hypothetical protein
MKYFLDTEFVETGVLIDLISIGLVSEDNRRYYAVSTEFNLRRAKAHPFVSAHVLPLLPKRYPDYADSPRIQGEAEYWKARMQIKTDILAFVGQDKSPEFWADYGAYDWVAFCQCFGTMMDLPGHFPMYCRELQQFAADHAPRDAEGYLLPEYLTEWAVTPEGSRPHHALDDAIETKRQWEILARYAAAKR